jgi:hypothetical protein
MTWVLEQETTPIPVRAARAGGEEQLDHRNRGAVPVTARRLDGGPVGEPRAWLVDAADGGPVAWRDHAERFDRTGLWPLLSCGRDRLFLDDEAPGPVADAWDVLGLSWEGTRLVSSDGTVWPHPPWPGLAAASGESSGAVVIEDVSWVRGALLLVPATRPADSIAQLGWYGACNWSLRPGDVAGVLRSWEDRFGAYVVGMGSADLDLVVTRPPLDVDQCRVLGDEHFAFCPDNFFPQDGREPGVIEPEEYARGLRGRRRWHFWWD